MVGESALSSGEAAGPDGEIARVVEPIDERLDGGVASAQDHRPGEPDGDEELCVVPLWATSRHQPYREGAGAATSVPRQRATETVLSVTRLVTSVAPRAWDLTGGVFE
jgi:hypothetical protein